MSSDSIMGLTIIAICGVGLGVKLFTSPGKLGRKLVIFFLSILGMYVGVLVYPPNPLRPSYIDNGFLSIAFMLAYAVYALFFDHD